MLNANYLLAQLRDAYDLPYDRLCMHEFVLSARTLKREHGVTALDVAKRLMDYDFHPPTIYFPLVVPEALMIEPTETEPKERLDAFVDAMLAIAREAEDDPELLHDAPRVAAGAAARRGEGREARRRQVRLRRAPGPLPARWGRPASSRRQQAHDGTGGDRPPRRRARASSTRAATSRTRSAPIRRRSTSRRRRS